jgi:hypothetical protein
MAGPTNPIEEHFDKGQWGFDGTLWRKLNLLWGYNDRWLEQVVNLAAPLGWAYLDSAAVPPGYVYIAHATAGVNQVTNPAHVAHGINIGGARYWFNTVPTPGINVYACWTAVQVFKVGDKGTVGFEGCAAGDILVAQWFGYMMKVA